MKNETLTVWAGVKLKECYDEVERENAGRKTIAQQIVHKRTDFLRRIKASYDGSGGITLSYIRPHSHRSYTVIGTRLKISLVGSPPGTERSNATGGAQLVENNTIGGTRTESRISRRERHACDAKVFRAHATLQGICENLINALKLLTSQQDDGDSPMDMFVQGLCEKSWLKIMNELRRFITTDNHEAVKCGDLEKYEVALEVVTGNFRADFPVAMVRNGRKELTLRAEEEGVNRTFIDTTNAGNLRWGPPLVDEDWHAICQAIFQAVEGLEWEAVHQQYVAMHRAVNTSKPHETKKVKALWRNG